MSRRAQAMLLMSIACPAWAGEAVYRVDLTLAPSPRIKVHATVPSDGESLAMATSRPGDVPEVADAGWPGLVRHLRVTDERGAVVATSPAGAAGWKLARPVQGTLTLDYEVDYAPLAARSWPAPRECAFADGDHVIVIGRSVFLTTPAQQASAVRFLAPGGWSAVTPWRGTVPTTDDLTENLIAFTKKAPDTLTAGGFQVRVVPIGSWETARAEVRRVIDLSVKRLVAFVGASGTADYLVVLLPQNEHGGESFRASFALTLDAAPSAANLDDWGNTIAHEIFHHWNGWILQGADYMATQWFQEGFTEYAANLALVSAGLTSPEQFEAKLASHVANYRKLQTPLDAPGTHKGPPLYGGGALVAFTWDTMIREATRNARGLGDVFRALLRDAKKPYSWTDIARALANVAPPDWTEFHHRFIHGTEPLPLDAAFARVGLKLTEGEGSVRVDSDPAATEAAKARFRALIGR
ncbi:MAG TPA: hypothetical protein VFV19_04210 [Candidatus Polarisedimenticolaceae bacterium]|nr:hypothetical protein [Candidatus Polarisedimenticolaceae bacterium]